MSRKIQEFVAIVRQLERYRMMIAEELGIRRDSRLKLEALLSRYTEIH